MARCGSVMQLPYSYQSYAPGSYDRSTYVKVYYQSTVSEEVYLKYRSQAFAFYGIDLDQFEYRSKWPYITMGDDAYERIFNIFNIVGCVAPEKDHFHMIDLFDFLFLIVKSLYPDFEFRKAPNQFDGKLIEYHKPFE